MMAHLLDDTAFMSERVLFSRAAPWRRHARDRTIARGYERVMLPQRRVFPPLAVASSILFAGCRSIDVDESDHEASYFEGRVRKELKRSDSGTATYLEAGWTHVSGDAGQLDYTIDMATVGGGIDMPVGEHGRVGVGGGLAWQLNDLEIAPADNDDHNGFGPFLACEAGWRLAPWLEPYARVMGAFYVDELDTMTAFEAGVRLHASEHAALSVGWRQSKYEMDDFDSGALTIDDIELDASGLIVGLLLSF